MVDTDLLISISPPAVAPEASASVPSFEVIRKGVQLSPPASLYGAPIRGDIAEIDGERFALAWSDGALLSSRIPPGTDIDAGPTVVNRGTTTVHERGPDGSVRQVTVELPPEVIPPPSLMHDTATLDPAGAIRRVLDSRKPTANHPCPWAALERESPADVEVRRFTREWPLIAAMMGLQALAQAPRLFDPGRVRYPIRTPQDPAIVSEIPWREYLDRHQAGDHGTHGPHDDRPLSEAELFTIPRQSVARINDHAILSGRGLVRSAYLLPDDLAGRLEPRGYMPMVGMIEVTTCLGYGPPETVMSLKVGPVSR